MGPRATVLILAVVLCTSIFASTALAATFDPNLVISDDNMRAEDSFTAADIQAFLVSKNSVLASRSFPRHDKGKTAQASVIIYEAARAWHINPQVLLVLLQKEQSLITGSFTGTTLTYKLDWAVGMGVPDDRARDTRFKGFGNQLWYAANRLNGYGEDGVIVGKFKSSGQRYGPVNPVNIATYKLYVYNPSIGATKPYPDSSLSGNAAGALSGNASFWLIYWRWFGDPFANPSLRPVYSFMVRSNGSYLYTVSPAEKYRLSRSPKSYSYKGAITSVNTSGGVNPVPVYKFLDRKTGVYTYTTSERTKRQRMAQPKKYSYRGVAFAASTNPIGRPVYRFVSKKNGADVLVVSRAGIRTYLSTAYRKKYRNAGIAFYIVP